MDANNNQLSYNNLTNNNQEILFESDWDGVLVIITSFRTIIAISARVYILMACTDSVIITSFLTTILPVIR